MKRKLSHLSVLNRLVKIAFDEIDYFRDNPKHLGWLMAQFTTVCYPGDGCINPKYLILDYETDNRDDMDYIYSAWGNTIGHGNHCVDSQNTSVFTKNMTMDEMIDLMSSPNYRYHDRYPTKESIVSFLLLTIGTGDGWYDGYITQMSHGYPVWMFTGYTTCRDEIRKDIVEKVDGLISCNPEIQESHQKEWVKINAYNIMSVEEQEMLSLRRVLDPRNEMSDEEFLERERKHKEFAKQWEEERPKTTDIVYYRINDDYANIANIPDNAHDSFVRESIIVLNQIINKECLFMCGGRDNREPSESEIKIANDILDRIRISHPHMMKEEVEC